MSRVKIRSNPYLKENEILIEDGSEWKPIIKDSSLNNNKFETGFFPFVVNEMLDILTKEKKSMDCIVFEGTEDDYNILLNVVNDNFPNIEVVKENTYLNNANEILKNIKNIYESAYSLIIDSVDNNEQIVKKDIDKFIDASNDVIPLCIVGNYSSGKSTFINSLIGMDILPSGSKPLTQNICKIVKSKFSINSYIRFEYNNQKFEITFSNSAYEITNGDKTNMIIVEIFNELEKLPTHTIEFHMNKTIEIINKYNDKVTKIEIELPFKGGILDKVDKNFVIFDTPGSDIATFTKHKDVLNKELKELTNGMMIFVVEKLDNDSNVDLFNMINNIDEIDKRFTMIVLNKADNEELPENGEFSKEEIDDIMSLSVPKNLYSNGIYYVSSILGLGAKINNAFVSKFNKEIYKKKKDDYIDKESEFYKELYRYNIMPLHLNTQLLTDAKSEDNVLFVNSGLYAIEHEITRFATEYASYNKCKQAKLFFEKIISITKNEIEKNSKESVKQKNDIKKLLSDEINKLKNDVQNEKIKYYNRFCEEYKSTLNTDKNNLTNNGKYDLNKMIEIEDRIKEKYEIEYGLQIEKDNANIRSNIIKDRINENLDNIKNSKGIEKLKQVPDLLYDAIDKGYDAINNKLNEAKIQNKINIDVAEELFENIKRDYDENIIKYKNIICESSKTFCQDKTTELKKGLLEFIVGSPNLTEKQKSCLKDIVVNYEDIKIDKDAKSIFIKNELKKGPKFLAGFTNKYDSNKLCKRYNDSLAESIDEIIIKVEDSHLSSIREWFTHLLNKLNEQIESLNPDLSERAASIKNLEDKIAKLINNEQKLNEYFEIINDSIEWKTK